MNKETFSLQLLTPAFVGGAACGKGPAELRVPTIRGQVRWWFRALGASRDQEGDVFGSVFRNPHPATASSVKLRIDGSEPSQTMARPLPHPGGEKVPPRNALVANTQFDLIVSENPLPTHPSNCFDLACLAVRTWALLGGMGFRANRGAGSVWPVPAPKSFAELCGELEALRQQAREHNLWNSQSLIGQALIDLLDKSYDSPEVARRDCTDTIETKHTGELGFVDKGERMASPLKVKVIHLPEESNPWRILRVGFPVKGKFGPEAGIRVLANHRDQNDRPAPKPLGGRGTPLL